MSVGRWKRLFTLWTSRNSFPEDDQYIPAHLIWPDLMPSDPSHRLATFTLTNIAPMMKSLYKGTVKFINMMMVLMRRKIMMGMMMRMMMTMMMMTGMMMTGMTMTGMMMIMMMMMMMMMTMMKLWLWR